MLLRPFMRAGGRRAQRKISIAVLMHEVLHGRDCFPPSEDESCGAHRCLVFVARGRVHWRWKFAGTGKTFFFFLQAEWTTPFTILLAVLSPFEPLSIRCPRSADCPYNCDGATRCTYCTTSRLFCHMINRRHVRLYTTKLHHVFDI